MKNGCNWRDLPKDFLPFQTVYYYYSQWRSDGTLDKLAKCCHQKLRELVEKNPLYSSLIMVDSQAVKNTCTAPKETSGFYFYKGTKLIDQGHHANAIRTALKEIYPAIDKKIKFEVSEKISTKEKRKNGLTGFVPQKMKWIIERSNAWVERCKNLIKNFEGTLKYAETRLSLCFTRLMLIRLAAG